MSVPIDITCLSNKEIQRILKNEGKSTSGNKATLIERLRCHLVEKQKTDSRQDDKEEDDEWPDNDDDCGLGASRYWKSHVDDTTLPKRHALYDSNDEEEYLRLKQRDAQEAADRARHEQEQIGAELRRVRLRKRMDTVKSDQENVSQRKHRWLDDYHDDAMSTGYIPPASASVRFSSPSASSRQRPSSKGTVQDYSLPVNVQSGQSLASSKRQRTPSAFKPQHHDTSASSSSGRVGEHDVPAAMLLQQQMLDVMSLPKPQLMTFDGDPLSFHVFLSLFDSSVHSANISSAAKLNRLFELCKGKALSVIALISEKSAARSKLSTST